MKIEIFADIVCPWCWIGRRRMDSALALRPDIKPELVWRAFLLNPSIPAQGMDRQAYLSAKFGHASSTVYDRIRATGEEVGLDFQFGKITRQPDSRRVHQLILAAAQAGKDISEAFYKAYFSDGLDISDPQLQEEICAAAGLHDLAGRPEMGNAASQLASDLAQGQQHRIEGVPFFVFNNRLALSGAHPPAILLNALDAARQPV